MSVPVPPEIRVTEIGEFIRHHACERRFKLEIGNRRLTRALPFADRLFNPLDPVLQEAGRQREEEWERMLIAEGLAALTTPGATPGDDDQPAWEDFARGATALAPGQAAYAREVRVAGEIGSFRISGRIDFILVLWHDGVPTLRLVECKASRRDRTYHRVQVALYRLLVRQLMLTTPACIGGVAVAPEAVECVVARIDETTERSQDILTLEPLDLAMEEADIERLLADEGALRRIIETDLDDLPYQLNQTCDGCIFNVDCLPESARQRRLELIGVDPVTARTLRSAGVATIDDLAELDRGGVTATALRRTSGFTDNLERLVTLARARRRTLPGGDLDPDDHDVMPVPHVGDGTLPAHEIDGRRLVRVYLAVDYDYVENRVGALSAHVTASAGQIHTDGTWEGKRFNPDPIVKERLEEIGRDAANRRVYAMGQLRGRDVVHFARTEWTGRYDFDTGMEKQLIQSFLMELVDAIAEVAEAEEAPIHFYVWSRAEMTSLIEACSRVSSRLLGSLRELLGCRESLEQLIYSSLQDEVDRRFALGWTGRGLSVVTSLTWFGRRYHWRRLVAGAPVDLDRAFTQDIFDFKTTLALDAGGNWADEDDPAAVKHRFEIRSRFHDSLTAPYWRAYWRTLPDPATMTGRDRRVAHAIERYNHARRPGYLQGYLTARVQALRWVEEGVRFKNAEIAKPLMRIAELPDFTLGGDNAAQASIDFLRLDQHIKVTNWVSEHLVPTAYRVPSGRTIPLRGVMSDGKGTLTATICAEWAGYDGTALANVCTIGEGSFVRLTPCAEDPYRGQTLRQLFWGARTCVVDAIDWEAGRVRLSVRFSPQGRYVLYSGGAGPEGRLFDCATLDESVSDFVAGRVDDRLQAGRGTHAYDWFDPETPAIPSQVPLSEAGLGRFAELLTAFALPNGRQLAEDQAAACLDALLTRVQLLLGPPGTGKTTVTAAATLLRILARRHRGDIMLIAAHTHTAVDTLLRRIDWLQDCFVSAAHEAGIALPDVRLAKVHSSGGYEPTGGRILDFPAAPSVTIVNRERANSVLVIGGTTGATLKLAKELSQRRPFRDAPDGFQVSTLIVDEASMMVFPHFLALATLVEPDGEIMLAGDHRQLAPIVAHDWEREDRPPVVLYQPFASAYEAVQNIARNPTVSGSAVRRSALHFTFRLPPAIRDLIARLYRLDDVELEGLAREPATPTEAATGGSWEEVWRGAHGLFLAVHGEHESKQSNEVEVRIVERLLDAAGALPDDSVAVITPHRAQRSLLRSRLACYGASVGVIDTVERLQGGERPTVIVSATVSDPSAIGERVKFILDLNRSNVAFSRAQDRLIVVCSDALLDYIPAEVEDYESALLWKSLRALCSQVVATEEVDGYRVQMLTPPLSTS